jgi:hypothetical protein
MWKVRTKIVPVGIRKLGSFKKGLDKNLQSLTGHPLAMEIQITLMSHARVC